MPLRPQHPCAHPGCDTLVRGVSKCEVHRKKDEQVRGTSTERGYDYKWMQKRKNYLAKNPWCSDPFGDHAGQKVRAMHVDHIERLVDGGADEESNYQGLCKHCHSKKTAKFDGGFGNRKSSEGRGGQNVSNF